MFNIVLFQPEIPPNTGNIIRLCANAGATLHLVKPLGFSLDEARLRRAGLDYAERVNITQHTDFASCRKHLGDVETFTFSSKSTRDHTSVRYTPGAALVFGPETRGLPTHVRDGVPERCRLTIPMMPGNRSLNLSNAVAIACYEAWRQLEFSGALGH